MSNTSQILSYRFLTQQITVYFGFLILISGVVGGLLTILVFTTLKTFRHTPCVFYLTTASVVNVGQLLTSLLIRILAMGFQIDPTRISWFCKLRVFLIQFSALVALTCMCLATIDQFMSMTHRRLTSLQLAHRYILTSCVLSTIHGIFFLIYFDSPMGVCVIVNANFGRYFSYVYFPVILGFLPMITMIVFAVLAFVGIRSSASRNVHVERLGRGRQLSAMVLIQAVFIVILTLPYLIANIYVITTVSADPIFLARNSFLQSVTILFYYESYAMSFYVCCCVSKRFRKQVVHVLFEIHLKRFRQVVNNINNNQVLPEITIT